MLAVSAVGALDLATGVIVDLSQLCTWHKLSLPPINNKCSSSIKTLLKHSSFACVRSSWPLCLCILPRFAHITPALPPVFL